MHKTPLNDFHHKAGAKLVDFAGWEMPVYYSSILEEHHHTRNHASFFDVSHMGRVEFHGSGALDFLQRLNVRNMEMKVGQCRYSHIYREDGGILDDVIVSRLDEHYLMVCNASNREKLLGWFEQQKSGFDVELRDRTFETAMIAIQGPEAIETCNNLLPVGIDELKRYHCKTGDVFGNAFVVARSGYTGEDGVEVTLPAGIAGMAIGMFMNETQAAGRPILPAGLGARDTLRTEAAMPLYGHELTEDWDPITAGQEWVVHWEHDFIGKAALQRVKEQGPERKLAGFEVDSKRTPRQGAKILNGDQEVGFVTSGVSSPTLGKVIAMGLIPPDLAAEGTELTIDVRTAQLPAKVVPLPFYKAKR